MDRRTLFLTAAATLTAAPQLAHAGPAAPKLGEDAIKHDNETASVGHASLMMAVIALEKADNPKVKQFARFERDQQLTVADVLKAIDPDISPLPSDSATLDVIAKLKEVKEGPEFDREFVSAQIQGHDKLRSIQEAYLQAGKDPDLVNASRLMLGMIKEHLALLGDLKRTA